MNALDALKLARETGVKVQPKGEPDVFSWDGAEFRVELPESVRTSWCSDIAVSDLVDESGNPVEWHVVE